MDASEISKLAVLAQMLLVSLPRFRSFAQELKGNCSGQLKQAIKCLEEVVDDLSGFQQPSRLVALNVRKSTLLLADKSTGTFEAGRALAWALELAGRV